MDLFRKAFYWFYPAIPKVAQTDQGKSMRTVMAWQCFFHFCFFVAMLTSIGFYAMLMELGWLIVSFSIYLTLREWMIVIYLITVLAGFIGKIRLMSNYTKSHLLFFILEIVFLVLSVIYVGNAYKDYRLSGGLKGKYHAANRFAKKIGGAVADKFKTTKANNVPNPGPDGP